MRLVRGGFHFGPSLYLSLLRVCCLPSKHSRVFFVLFMPCSYEVIKEDLFQGVIHHSPYHRLHTKSCSSEFVLIFPKFRESSQRVWDLLLEFFCNHHLHCGPDLWFLMFWSRRRLHLSLFSSLTIKQCVLTLVNVQVRLPTACGRGFHLGFCWCLIAIWHPIQVCWS